MSAIEYLLRVRHNGDVYAASIRQVVGANHPEVRAVVGQVAFGTGDNALAAMVAAVANSRVLEVHEVRRVD